MANLVTLVSFDGDDGAFPYYENLYVDAAGDVFGTTSDYGSGDDGTVFEIANSPTGYAPLATLASFNGANGFAPYAGLISDAAGDLFGVTSGDDTGNDGSVFEIAKTSSGYAAPTTLATFNGTNGSFPFYGLATDAAGDLFGTTNEGGADGLGTIFEVTKTSGGYGPLTTLATFNGTNGELAIGGLISDAAGDLFGTTTGGGAADDGIIFELAHTASGYGAPTTLAAFNGANGAYPYGELAMDSAGDLFGTTSEGGADGVGTVFEIAAGPGGYGPVTTLASFDVTHGETPMAGVTIDAAGDIFGTTQFGGANDDGIVFEIAKTAGGYGPLTTLLSFNGTNGADPAGGLTPDAAGDLFGTTLVGGDVGGGTVFEITNSGFVVTPSITGTVAGQETGVQAPDKPFATVAIGDAIAGSTVTVAIQLAGGGFLADGAGYSGLTKTATPGLYSLSGSAIADTHEIDALVFTPAVSATHSAATTAFTLTATTNTGASASNNATTVLVDPGPTTGAVSSSLTEGASVDLTSLILGAAKPGIAGDKLTISADNTVSTLGAVSLVNGDLVYSATTAALMTIPANGSVTDSFGYTIADAFGDAATGTVKITVTNPVTVINGPSYGVATIQGVSHNEVINAYGWYNTIYANGGSGTINAGQGNATVYAGAGNLVVNLQGYYNTVSGTDGTDTVSGSAGNTSVTLGNGADSVSTGGYYNTINLGSGNDTVSAGSGNATVTLGNGADRVTASGYSNAITVGNGSDTIVAGSGLDKVVAGSGVDTITLAGQNNSVTLNGTSATVAGGQGADTVVANGGSDKLTFAGPNSQATLNGTVSASLIDNGQTFRLYIGSSTQTDTITGFGSSDTHALLDLLHGAGGYTSAAAVVSALHSDSHGGTLLSLGASGSIDFLGTAPSQLHASNFQIG